MLIWLGIAAFSLLIYSIYVSNFEVSAASLAVIIATISSVFAYEIIHKDRLNQLPAVTINFDSTSRYGLWQLVFTNVGGSTAFNVQLEWLSGMSGIQDKFFVPRNIRKETVAFHQQKVFDRIAALQKDEKYYLFIDEFHAFFEKNDPAIFLAKITFEDNIIHGEKYTSIVPISLEEQKTTLDYINERSKTEYRIQQLPEKLNEIKLQLEKLNNNIAN